LPFLSFLTFEQINEAVAQMDEGLQQNAALIEETAAASNTMQDQAAPAF
jgi:methyl-accepting chemotaxis protein